MKHALVLGILALTFLLYWQRPVANARVTPATQRKSPTGVLTPRDRETQSVLGIQKISVKSFADPAFVAREGEIFSIFDAEERARVFEASGHDSNAYAQAAYAVLRKAKYSGDATEADFRIHILALEHLIQSRSSASEIFREELITQHTARIEQLGKGVERSLRALDLERLLSRVENEEALRDRYYETESPILRSIVFDLLEKRYLQNGMNASEVQQLLREQGIHRESEWKWVGPSEEKRSQS